MTARARLSVLDPSPVFAGRTAQEALGETRALAEAADSLGYRAFWVQEHHNAPSFAGTAPEILIADLAARTSRLMIGSGGVMLANYSPLKVAEQFTTLSALYPGRIELGLGRATGADPRTSAALLGPGSEAFPQMLRMLIDWLQDASGEVPLPDNHRARGIHARPAGARPDVWLLASSPESAAFAGAMGLKLAFAEFLNPGGSTDALKAYREAFEPSLIAPEPHAGVALVTLAAPTREEARRLGAPAAAWNIKRAQGRFAPFPGETETAAILDEAGPAAVDYARARSLSGTGADVAAGLGEIARSAGADEFFLLTIAPSVETRIDSLRRIADAWDSAAW
ncbi:MAG: MsnO8 family LLM class oxidoreductase [Alphaproteobacteria bacterium]|jgi:luciferase family oxidoreductase group 1|nr:MsnO8 family LLM class oxidoreductase [Alphaproteobacteria bacterium]